MHKRTTNATATSAGMAKPTAMARAVPIVAAIAKEHADSTGNG